MEKVIVDGKEIIISKETLKLLKDIRQGFDDLKNGRFTIENH